MNNAELETLLRSAPVPERTRDYWEQFPKRITAKTYWQTGRPAALETASRSRSNPAAMRWGLGLASACLLVGLILSLWTRQVPNDPAPPPTQAKQYFHEIATLFPHQVQAIVFDAQGVRFMLADKADVPDSPPLYLKIMGPQGWRSFVTFSGQQIRFNGEDCDVLADGQGNVMLVGRQLLWNSAYPAPRAGKYRIAAQTLETSS